MFNIYGRVLVKFRIQIVKKVKYYGNTILLIFFKDKNGRTALHLAATNSRYLRLRRQISTSPVYIDETELMRRKGSELELVSNRSAKCCEILLNHEADPCLRDNHVSVRQISYSGFSMISRVLERI